MGALLKALQLGLKFVGRHTLATTFMVGGAVSVTGYVAFRGSGTDAVTKDGSVLREVAVSDEAGRLRMKVQGIGEKTGVKGAELSGVGEKSKVWEALESAAQESEEKKGNEAEKEESKQEEVPEEKQPEELKDESLESDGENTDASSDVSGADVFSSSSSDAGGGQLSFEQGNDEETEQQKLAEEREKLDLRQQELEEKQKELEERQQELAQKENLNEEEKRQLEDLKKEQDALNKEKENLDKRKENLGNEIKEQFEKKEDEQFEKKEDEQFEEKEDEQFEKKEDEQFEKKEDEQFEKKEDEKNEDKKEEPKVEEKAQLNEEKLDFEKNKKGEVYKDPVANNKVKVDAGVPERAPVFGGKSVEHHEESVVDRKKRWTGKLHEQFAKEQDYEVEDECYDVFASQEIVKLAANPKYKVGILTLKWNPSVKDLKSLKETFLSSLRSVVSRKDRNPGLRLHVLCGASLMDKYEDPEGIVVKVEKGRNEEERCRGGNLFITFKNEEPEVVPEKPEGKGKERVAGRVYSFEVDQKGYLQDEDLISDLKSEALDGRSFMDALLRYNAKANPKTEILALFDKEGVPLIKLSADEIALGKGMFFAFCSRVDIDKNDRRFLIDGGEKFWTIFVLDGEKLNERQMNILKDVYSRATLGNKDGDFLIPKYSFLCDCLQRKFLSSDDIVDIVNRHNEVRPSNRVLHVVHEGLLPFDIREAKGTFFTDNKEFKEECEKDNEATGKWKISVPQVEPSDRSGENEYKGKSELEGLLLKLPETEWYKKRREEYEKGGEKLDEEKRKTYLSNFSVDFDFEQHGVGDLYWQLCSLPEEAMKTIRYFIIPAAFEDIDKKARARFVWDLVVHGWYFPDGESGLQDALEYKRFEVQYTGGTTRCVLTPYLTDLVYSNKEILNELGETENGLPRQTQGLIRRPLIFAYGYNNFDKKSMGEVDEQYLTNRLKLGSEEVPASVRKKIKELITETDEENVQVLDAVCFYYEQLYTGRQGIGSRNYFLHPWLIDKMFQSSEGLFGGDNQKCNRLVPGVTFIYDVNGNDISANKESKAQKNAGIRALDDTFGKPYLFSYHNSPAYDYAMSGDSCWFRIEKPDAKAWFVSFYDPDVNVMGKNDRNQKFNKKKKCIAIRWTFKPLKYKDGDKEEDTPEAESYQRANCIPALIPQFSEKPVTKEAREYAGAYMTLFKGWQAMDELKRSFAEKKDRHKVSFEVLCQVRMCGLDVILSKGSKVKSLRIEYPDNGCIPPEETKDFLERICAACERNGTAIIKDVNIDVEYFIPFCKSFNNEVRGDFCILPVEEGVEEGVVRFAPRIEWNKWLENHSSKEEKAGDEDYFSDEEGEGSEDSDGESVSAKLNTIEEKEYEASSEEKDHEEDMKEEEKEEEGDKKFANAKAKLISILEKELSKDDLIEGFKEDLQERFKNDFVFVKEDNGELEWDDSVSFVMNKTVERDLLSGGTRFVAGCIPEIKKVCEKEKDKARCVSLGYKHILYYCINGKMFEERINADMLNSAIQGKVENVPGDGNCLVWAIAKGEAKLNDRKYERVTEAEMLKLRRKAMSVFTKNMNKKNNTVKVDGIEFPSMYGSAYRVEKEKLVELQKSEGAADRVSIVKQKEQRIEELKRDFTVDALKIRIGVNGKEMFCEDVRYFSKVLHRTVFVYAENQGQCTFAFPDGSFFQIGCSHRNLQEVFTEDQAKQLLPVKQDLKESGGVTHYQTITEGGRRALFNYFGYRTKDMGKALADLCSDKNMTIDLTNFSQMEAVAGKEVERPKGDADRSCKARILFESDRKEFISACFDNKNVVRLVLPAYAHVEGDLSDVLRTASTMEELPSLKLYFGNNGFYDPDEVFPPSGEINRLNATLSNASRYIVVSEKDENGANYLCFKTNAF